MDCAAIIEKLTLLEKAALLSGKNVWQTREIPRLGISAISLSDGPHGLRRQAGEGDHLGLNASLPATCFPTAATVANSWNPTLGEEIGAALGREARALGVDVVLGPGLNIKRSPLCGRNFEYFSEDPYLAGKLAAGYVRGIQSQNVAACPKHFAANSQELRRMASDSVLDERTLREIYLTGFEIVVREATPRCIMSSYNLVNGTYANVHPQLLQDILRQEWGFDGMVVTDWGGSNSHVEGVRNGSALEMPAPGLDSARQLVAAVQSGELPEAALDARLAELLAVVLAAPQEVLPHWDEAAHHTLAQKAAEQSIVLLKNEGGVLPLTQDTTVALIGDFAKVPRYQGAGSSLVNPTRVDNTLDCIPTSGLKLAGYAQGYTRGGGVDEILIQEAATLAATAQVTLLYIGLDEMSESEGQDRTHMRLPDCQNALVEAVLAANPSTVVVLSAGSAIEMPWAARCPAIVHGYLGGQAGAQAMLNVLTGSVNPSGKLAETFPLAGQDAPTAAWWPGEGRYAEYREGLYVGYRYYETLQKPVLFPFGHGLSYSSFEYSDLQIEDGKVCFTLENTGKWDGAEVAQVYISRRGEGVFRPLCELKGFARVALRAGEARPVSIPLDDKAFRYFNTATAQWETEAGEYEILVGASVRDIRLRTTIGKEGTGAKNPYDPAALPSYYSGDAADVPDEEFAALLGRPLPREAQDGLLGINDAINTMGRAKSPVARLAYRILTGMKRRSEQKGKPDLNILFIYNMPLRAIAKMTNGAVSMEMVEGMVLVVNGNFFRGMGRVIGGFFRNRRLNKQCEAELAQGPAEQS